MIYANQVPEFYDHSVIFVSVSKLLLQIYVQWPDDQQATHIDIPIENISKSSCVPSMDDEPDIAAPTIMIMLHTTIGITCYVNAGSQVFESVEIGFKTPAPAFELLDLLMRANQLEENTRTIHGNPTSTIPGSHSAFGGTQEPAQIDTTKSTEHTPSVDSHADLVATAVQATSLIILPEADAEVNHHKSLEVSEKGPRALSGSSTQVIKKQQRPETRAIQAANGHGSQYDIPTSPTLPAKEIPQRGRPARYTRRMPVEPRKSPDVAQDADRQLGISSKPGSSSTAQCQAGRPRSRRVAAIDADKKIRGTDPSATKVQRTGLQNGTFKGKRAPLMKKRTVGSQNGPVETASNNGEPSIPAGPSQEAILEMAVDPNASHMGQIGHPRQDTGTGKKHTHDTLLNPAQQRSPAEQISLVQKNVKSLDRGVPQFQSNVTGAQVIQQEVSDVTARDSTAPPASKPSKSLEMRAHMSHLPASRDPFASRLSAVVATARSPNVHFTIANGELSPKNVEPLKGPQEAKRRLGRPSTIHRLGNPATPSLPTSDTNSTRPLQRPKRKATVQFVSTQKKPNHRSIDSYESPPVTGRTPPPPAIRKTPIISFSSSGPRNQGIEIKARAKQLKQQKSIQLGTGANDLNGKIDNAVERFVVPRVPIDAIKTQKQMLPPDTGTAIEQPLDLPSDTEPLIQPEIKELPHMRQGRPLQQVVTSKVGLKPSSQTTRVNENGSPMPSRHPNNRSISSPVLGTSSDIQDAPSPECEKVIADSDGDHDRDHVFLVPTDDKSRKVQQKPPTVRPPMFDLSQSSMPSMGAYRLFKPSVSQRNAPSPPQAPAVTFAHSDHHMHQSGERNPLPMEKGVTKDLFPDLTTEISHFSHLLQSASAKATKRPAEAMIEGCVKKARLSADNSAVDDPEETLVELSETPPRGRKIKTIEVPSTGSSSSLSEDTAVENVSPTLIEDMTEQTSDQYAKTLHPHQRNVLDVLIQISHQLLAHMAQSEDAFMLLFDDYKRSGNLLIDHLEKQHEAENLARTASSEALRQKFARLFQKNSADLELKTEEIMGRTEGVKKEWKSAQDALMAKVDEALALCVT